jgi:hypothetical protein
MTDQYILWREHDNPGFVREVLPNNYIVRGVPDVLACELMSSEIKKFVMMREALVNEKASLEAQIGTLQARHAEIVAALDDSPSAAPANRKGGRSPGKVKQAAAEKAPKAAPKKKATKKKAAKKKAGPRSGRRSQSAVPLKETMLSVLGKWSLTRQDIAAGVAAAGYSSANVLNSVSATLYQNKAFKKDGKKWKAA